MYHHDRHRPGSFDVLVLYMTLNRNSLSLLYMNENYIFLLKIFLQIGLMNHFTFKSSCFGSQVVLRISLYNDLPVTHLTIISRSFSKKNEYKRKYLRKDSSGINLFFILGDSLLIHRGLIKRWVLELNRNPYYTILSEHPNWLAMVLVIYTVRIFNV